MQLGALLDTRTPEAKLKDFKSYEVASAFQLPTYSKTRLEDCRMFPARDQGSSSSCVAHTAAKMLGIENHIEENRFIDFSAYDIYERRANKPAEGMIGVDALNICTKAGATLENFVPSMRMNEPQMNTALNRTVSDVEVARVFRAGGFVTIPRTTDINEIASIIEHQKKGVMVWFYFTAQEWSRTEPVIMNNALTVETGLRHSVTAVDTLRWNGKRALLIEDSAHFGGTAYRIVTEDFFAKRCWFAAYFLNFKNEWTQSTLPPKPRYTFNKIMQFTETYTVDEDVRKLQECLQWAGFFPSNIDKTGYYGAITAKAVLGYQTARKVAPTSELEALQGMRVGNKTLAVLNNEFGI